MESCDVKSLVWNSVDDKLPKEDTKVIIFQFHGVTKTSWYGRCIFRDASVREICTHPESEWLSDVGFWRRDSVDKKEDLEDNKQGMDWVTHWMEVPDAPWYINEYTAVVHNKSAENMIRKYMYDRYYVD